MRIHTDFTGGNILVEKVESGVVFKVYFAHNMLYHPERFTVFCKEKGLVPETICTSVKGRDLPGIRLGNGDTWILLTSRHHACEAPGSYVLELRTGNTG